MIRRKDLLFLLVLNRFVYEGEEIQLEGFCNLDQSKKANNNIVYDWYFISEKSDKEISQKEFKGIKKILLLQLHMLIFGRIREMIRMLKIKIFGTKKYKTFSKLTFELIATDKIQI